jgi:hypothetical protein
MRLISTATRGHPGYNWQGLEVVTDGQRERFFVITSPGHAAPIAISSEGVGTTNVQQGGPGVERASGFKGFCQEALFWRARRKDE